MRKTGRCTRESTWLCSSIFVVLYCVNIDKVCGVWRDMPSNSESSRRRKKSFNSFKFNIITTAYVRILIFEYVLYKHFAGYSQFSLHKLFFTVIYFFIVRLSFVYDHYQTNKITLVFMQAGNTTIYFPGYPPIP